MTMTSEPAALHRRRWTPADTDKLMFWWGNFKLQTIATRLNRTPWGVARKARDLGLGPFSKGSGISMAEFERYSGFSIMKIRAAAKALDIKLKRRDRSDPIKNRRYRAFLIDEDQQDALLKHMLENPVIFQNEEGAQKTTQGQWGIGKKPPACKRCSRTSKPHYARGLCASCYQFYSKKKVKMPNTISAFKGPHRFLSNFHPSVVLFEGVKYYSVEHAFQAAKTLDHKLRTPLSLAHGTELSWNPGKAKHYGRRLELRPDWEDVKLSVMEQLLREKFEIPELRMKLLNTRDRELIEGNTWGDIIWGMVETGDGWHGENHLGKLLMKIRKELAHPE